MFIDRTVELGGNEGDQPVALADWRIEYSLS